MYDIKNPPFEIYPKEYRDMLLTIADIYQCPHSVFATNIAYLGTIINGRHCTQLYSLPEQAGNEFIMLVTKQDSDKSTLQNIFFNHVFDYIQHENKKKSGKKISLQISNDCTIRKIVSKLNKTPYFTWFTSGIARLISRPTLGKNTTTRFFNANLRSLCDGYLFNEDFTRCYLNLFVYIEPASFYNLSKHDYIGQGVLERCIIIIEQFNNNMIVKELPKQFDKMLGELTVHFISLPDTYDNVGRCQPRYVPMTLDAQKTFVDWYNMSAKEAYVINRVGLKNRISMHATRCALHLCLLDTFYKHREKLEIDKGIIERAIVFGDWLWESQNTIYDQFYSLEKEENRVIDLSSSARVIELSSLERAVFDAVFALGKVEFTTQEIIKQMVGENMESKRSTDGIGRLLSGINKKFNKLIFQKRTISNKHFWRVDGKLLGTIKSKMEKKSKYRVNA